MTEYESSKLDHEKHLLLDQPLLRLPNELARHNLKTAQVWLKTTQDKVNSDITAGTRANAQATPPNGDEAGPEAATSSIDQAIHRLKTLKRKLETLNDSTQELHRQSEARVRHLEELYTIPSLADVKYEDWSRVRLDRLLVDYLLRMGYTESARELAREKNIEQLVDCEAFAECGRVERSLRVERKIDAALAWCSENRQTLKKMSNSTFEYELRLQQFVEMARSGHSSGDMQKLNEARTHAMKHLASHPDPEWKSRAATLLAIPPRKIDHVIGGGDASDPYEGHRRARIVDGKLEIWTQEQLKLYSSDRWAGLASLFLETHHSMFQLPQPPLLHMALTAGLSALKTPACHSKFLSPSSGLNSTTQGHTQPDGSFSPPLRDDFDYMDGVLSSTGEIAGNASASLSTTVCPICSTELNKLSKTLPFAHHAKSYVEPDPVVLPNGRVYGREKLEKLNEKLGTRTDLVRDPVDLGRVYRWEECGKVYFL